MSIQKSIMRQSKKYCQKHPLQLTPAPMRNCSVRLPRSLWNSVVKYAAIDGVRPSDIIRDATLTVIQDRDTVPLHRKNANRKGRSRYGK